MPRFEVPMQPKQCDVLDLVENDPAVVIGVGGGRGAAKSSGGDRIAIHLMYDHPGIVGCIMMRNWDQVFKYHVEPIRRDFPWLEDSLKTSMPAKLRIGKSELDFSYAENYDDVERRFRSANYAFIIIDQAEQFTEREIREIRKACRTKGKFKAKLILLFNMRGSGIQTLRKWFHVGEFNKDENPKDYSFLKVNPWDNIEWVRPALEADGYTEFDFYAWTDDQRRDYSASRGEYTRQLASDDEVIRASDWYGGWDSLEGAYFANSFDLESTRITGPLASAMMKPWSSLWLSQDWGKAHWCSSHWHYRVTLSPSEVKRFIGWDRNTPLNVICTHREMIVSELTSVEVGRKLVECTPFDERERMKSFFLSPDAFGERDSANTIATQQAKELRPFNMPGPVRADDDRKGGWSLMAKLLKATKEKGVDKEGKEHADCWFISSECVELLKAIPMLMRDPKDIDDVLKTDKSQAKIEQDVADDVRYGLKSMLAPRKKSAEDEYREKVVVAEPAEKLMMMFRHEQAKKKPKHQRMPPSWKANL